MAKTVYFDCFSGASGDMVLGALLDLGLPLDELKAALGSLAIEYGSVSAERVLRAGVSATKFDVQLPTDGAHEHGHEHEHEPAHAHAGAARHDHAHPHAHTHTHAPAADAAPKGAPLPGARPAAARRFRGPSGRRSAPRSAGRRCRSPRAGRARDGR